MHPKLLDLPGDSVDLNTYGVFMAVGFLLATFMAIRRALRVHASPDVILNLGLLSFIGGIAGARIFYVVQFWHDRFAPLISPAAGWWANTLTLAGATLDLSRGGMVFYGGWIGAMLLACGYLLLYRHSLRWYLDLCAPSLMVGLAFGRLGCFFNGCCFGRVCPTGSTAALIAASFPFGSPSAHAQWNMLDLPLPTELIYTIRPIPDAPSGTFTTAWMPPAMIPADHLDLSPQAIHDWTSRRDALLDPSNDPDQTIARMRQFLLNPRDEPAALMATHLDRHGLSLDQLRTIAAQFRARPVYPVQIFAAIGALTIWLVAEVYLRRRRHHGMVICLVAGLYAVNRFLEETIRNDNPFDTAGLTVSQFISLLLLAASLLTALWIRFTLPPASSWVRPLMRNPDLRTPPPQPLHPSATQT